MVKDKHKEYKLEDLQEAKDSRMVDPHINPNKDDYSKDEELGIRDHHGGKRWTTYGFEKKTPQMEQLKRVIKECIKEILTEK